MNILEARRRVLGGEVIKRTAEGNPISVRSLARRYPGITMQGWTEQAQYEGKNLFDISYASQLSSWSGGNTYRHLVGVDLKPNTTYTLFVQKNNMYLGYNPDYDGKFSFYLGEIMDSDAAPNYGFGNTNISVAPVSYTFTTTDNPYYINMYVQEWSEENIHIVFDELLVDVMLVEGNTTVPYEPYTGGAPSPSPDYPQEIVSAGNWNEETQKWDYEIEVGGNGGSSQTVLLTSDRPLTKWDKLEKRGGQWGWVYKSKQIILNGTILNIIGNGTWGNIDDYKTIAFYSYINGKNNSQDIGVDMSRADEALTNQFSYGHVYNNDDVNKFTISSSGGYIAFRIDADMLPDWSSEAPSNQPFIDWLDEKEQAGKPVTLLYPTIEETFVPLSASEQEQMNSLHTFRPTTVLSNDAGCEMSLTYKTKKVWR